jgi:hypothetical protein
MHIDTQAREVKHVQVCEHYKEARVLPLFLFLFLFLLLLLLLLRLLL